MIVFPSATFHRPLQRQTGFSLVEVTLAIGIVAFAFVALFGMVPTGLNLFRGAIDTSLSTQILQQVVDNAQQTDFESLVNVDKATHKPTGVPIITKYLFDDEGNDVTAQYSANNASSTVYPLYTVYVTANAPAYMPPNMPPSGGVPDPAASTLVASPNVAIIKVVIAKDPLHQFATPTAVPTPTPAGGNSSQTAVIYYTTYVSRNSVNP